MELETASLPTSAEVEVRPLINLDSEAAVASSDLELEIPFSFGPRYGGSPPISRGEGSGKRGGQGMI